MEKLISHGRERDRRNPFRAVGLEDFARRQRGVIPHTCGGIRCAAVSPRHCRPTGCANKAKHLLSSLRKQGPIATVVDCPGKAVDLPARQYPPRRMGPGSRSLRSLVRDDGDGSHCDTEYDSAFSRLEKPEVCMNLSLPPKSEGAGNAGCLLHPRSRVQDGVRCAHEHTGTAGALRHPLRNGLTAYAELSLETNSFCLHRCRLDGSIDPVGSTSPPAA
jgi:hypothetical protein